MKVAGRTGRVDKWIDDISRWKRTYGITGIEARKGSALNSCMPKAAKPYPSGFVEAEVESIRREIKLMQALDADIQKILGVDEKSKIWMEEMHEAIEDAKKFFDSYDHFPIKKCMLSFHKVLSFYFFPLQDEGSNSLLELKNKIQTIFDRRTRYSVEQFNRPGNVNHGITAMLLSEEITAEKDLLIIPVIDLKVTSQSYLNELIHSSDAIINHFDRRIWVKIPEDFNPVRVLYDIEEQLKQEEKERMGNVDNPLVARPRGLEKEICTEEEELKQTLDDLLVHRRYLIVLNGIQSAEAWNCLQTYFPNASNGSRIVLITQNIDEEKWILSCQKFESEMNEEQRQKLTGKGKFQLLAPVKLGELPPKYGTVSEWERKLMQPRHVSESLDISYGSAPSYLWRCLFCLLIFPNGEEISARRLIALWVAEGIVRPKKGDSKPAEYLAESYLNQLIDLKMIEATNTKHNGKVKACMLNKNMLETLSKKAKEANFFKDQAGDSVFRLVFNPVNQNSVFCHINGDEICSSSLLRVCYQKAISFHSFDTGEASKYGDNIGNFLRRCIFNRCFASLRVLDLERVFKPKLPTALELIRSLRYLGLRWTYLESLPPRVSKLLNLEVLDIKRTYISSLPKSIWQMQYLRHLYLSETYGSQFRSRPRNRSLTNLQTLWGAFIDEDSPVLDGLDTIVNVRKLGLTCRSMSSAEDMESQLVAVRNWIWKLKKNLEHLRLKSYDTGGNPSDLQLEKLLDHDKLSSIYLLGKLRDSSVNSLFPSSLTEITLSGSELKNDPMITLEKLPNLIILRLLARSTTCMTMCCSQGGFPLLQILKIWNLEQLVEWKIEKRALLGLKKLEIRCCKNLKMLPDGLRHVETLQELMLCLMPQSFTDSIQDDQPVMWGKIKEILEVVRD